jgi:hypothetical protein
MEPTHGQESLSVVIPFFNEEGNAGQLIAELHDALEGLDMPWEVVAVNDGSRDATSEELEGSRRRFGRQVCVVNFARNFGQTAAMQTGIDRARGSLIVTMDGDRQNDPKDIPRLINYLVENDLDMVSGWRKDRQDDVIRRKLPSRVANRLIRRTTGVDVRDSGCSLKIFRAHIIKQVVLMGEMHRFTSAWVASVTDPKRIGEMAVSHRARTVGSSKYGLSRTTRVILDLVVVLFFMRFSRRPGHFFGTLGLASMVVSAAVLAYTIIVLGAQGQPLTTTPSFMIGISLLFISVQLLTAGVLAEILTRSGPSKAYPIRTETLNYEREWKRPE